MQGCNIGEMKQTKWYQVKGKVSEMACRINECSKRGVDETAVGEMVLYTD
jgi:hypothetical protein